MILLLILLKFLYFVKILFCRHDRDEIGGDTLLSGKDKNVIHTYTTYNYIT